MTTPGPELSPHNPYDPTNIPNLNIEPMVPVELTPPAPRGPEFDRSNVDVQKAGYLVQLAREGGVPNPDVYSDMRAWVADTANTASYSLETRNMVNKDGTELPMKEDDLYDVVKHLSPANWLLSKEERGALGKLGGETSRIAVDALPDMMRDEIEYKLDQAATTEERAEILKDLRARANRLLGMHTAAEGVIKQGREERASTLRERRMELMRGKGLALTPEEEAHAAESLHKKVYDREYRKAVSAVAASAPEGISRADLLAEAASRAKVIANKERDDYLAARTSSTTGEAKKAPSLPTRLAYKPRTEVRLAQWDASNADTIEEINEERLQAAKDLGMVPGQAVLDQLHAQYREGTVQPGTVKAPKGTGTNLATQHRDGHVEEILSGEMKFPWYKGMAQKDLPASEGGGIISQGRGVLRRRNLMYLEQHQTAMEQQLAAVEANPRSTPFEKAELRAYVEEVRERRKRAETLIPSSHAQSYQYRGNRYGVSRRDTRRRAQEVQAAYDAAMEAHGLPLRPKDAGLSARQMDQMPRIPENLRRLLRDREEVAYGAILDRLVA